MSLTSINATNNLIIYQVAIEITGTGILLRNVILDKSFRQLLIKYCLIHTTLTIKGGVGWNTGRSTKWIEPSGVSVQHNKFVRKTKVR